jgi:hypothetical protein
VEAFYFWQSTGIPNGRRESEMQQQYAGSHKRTLLKEWERSGAAEDKEHVL